MAFFDDWSRKIGQMGQSTLQKTKDAAGVARINSQIYEEEKKLNNLYLEIGKRYALLHGDDFEEALADSMQEVKAVSARIDEYKEQIRLIKGIRVCERCGTEVADGSLFCSNCGNRIAEPIKESGQWCANCGTALQSGTLFCTNCGAPVKKMENQSEQEEVLLYPGGESAEEPEQEEAFEYDENADYGIREEEAADREDFSDQYQCTSGQCPENEEGAEGVSSGDFSETLEKEEETFGEEFSGAKEEEILEGKLSEREEVCPSMEESSVSVQKTEEPRKEDSAEEVTETKIGWEEKPAAPRICPNCGMTVRENMIFCTNCGHRIL